MGKFVNLYTQTEYSLLSSLIKIDNISNLLKEYDYETCAICDDGMYGTLKFYNKLKENNQKPIIGLRLRLTNENCESYILLYATSIIGYHNLLRISTKERITKDEIFLESIREYGYGIIAVLPHTETDVYFYYKNNAIKKIEELLDQYHSVFKDLYMGISLQTLEERNTADELINIASRKNIESVAINKTAYLSEDDIESFRVLRSIDKNTKGLNLTPKDQSLSFLSSVEGDILFQKYPTLIDNTVKISSMCNLEIPFGTYKYPTYGIQNSKEYLVELCKVGLNKRLKNKKTLKKSVLEYKNRLMYELEIIEKMGFSDYFLIVFDYVRFAKNNDILVGPGRGSAGSSLVSYALGITDIDPLDYDLLFERFLNPERKSMPDIDVDFPDDRREEVIRYLGTKYGQNRVAHITTFGTFKARLAIRDVARILEINEKRFDEVIKYIPLSYGASSLSIKKIISQTPQLNRMMEENDDIFRLLTIASKIEGLPRNCSTHAAGVIMADKDLTNYTPLQPGIDGLLQTQFEASDLELLGLIKMDILGLRNLTIIKNVLRDIEKDEHKKINIIDIPLDDKEVYNNIKKADTSGIFQLESAGVRKLLKELECSEFIDIVNATSLYRPGPMEMIPEFVKRKKGQKYEYIHNDVKEILSSTYGIIVFQEQIMLIAQKIAGYSLGQADVLRRAVSKKKKDLIEEERKTFIASAIKNGYTLQVASNIYDYIEKFASYGFNKSHGVAYGLIAYQMAYLKTHYYKNFMTSLMTNSIGSISYITKYVSECKKNNVVVNLPNINISTNKFESFSSQIYLPLLCIMNLGESAVKDILEEREKGLFLSYDDFLIRTTSLISKRQVLSLINAGALDVFDLTRKGMTLAYDDIIQKASYMSSMQGKIVKTEISQEEYNFEEISIKEKETLGFNLKYSMFIKFKDLKESKQATSINELHDKKTEKIIFVIRSIREIKTKKQEKMAFLEAYDESGTIDMILFPKVYQEVHEKLFVNKAYIASCKIEKREDKLQAVIDSIYNLD